MGKAKEKTNKITTCLFLIAAVGILLNAVVVLPVYAQISEADPYTNINWKCIRANSALKFKVSETYPGEAYWYSGNNSISSFESKIKNTAFIPGGYRDAANATNRAGIDCSGFVGRVWGFGDTKVGTVTLSNYSRKIKKEQLQQRDILNAYNNHVVLFDEWDSDLNYLWIYHAKGSGNPNDENEPGNMVVREKVAYSDYSETLGYLPRRKGIFAPVSCSMINNATDVSLRPTIVVKLNGPARPESINSSSILLKKHSGGLPIDGTLVYDEDAYQITFTPLSNLEKNTKYKFKVKDYVKDLEGRALDTDLDGKKGGRALEKAFTTGDSLGIIDLINWAWTESAAGSSGISATGVSAMETGDNIIDLGETIQLTLTLTNTGSQSATSVSGTLSTMTNVDIASSTATQNFGTIAPGSAVSNSDKFIFEVPELYNGSDIEFKLDVTGWMGSDFYTDDFTFRLPVGTAFLGPPGAKISEELDFGFYYFPNSSTLYHTIDDKTNPNTDIWGNDNGQFDQGDYSINVIFYAGNASDYTLDAEFQLHDLSDPKKVDIYQSIKQITVQPRSHVEIPFKITLATDPNNSTVVPLGITMTIPGQQPRVGTLDLFYTVPPSQGIYISSLDPPDVFSPNGDGIRETLTINFNVPELLNVIYLRVREKLPSGEWGDWQVCNNRNAVVENLLIFKKKKFGQSLPEYKPEDDHTMSWTNGNEFESGVYEIHLSGGRAGIQISQGVKGAIRTPYWEQWFFSDSKTIRLHKTSPQADNLDNTNKFSAMNAALPGSATLSYDLTLAADTTIKVRNSDGEEVYTLADVALSPAGNKEYVFQNYDSENNILSDGEYTFNINLDDRANPAKSYVKEFIIDHAPQDFYLITATNEVLTATKEYPLSWTSASPYGSAWNHLKEYQVLGRKIDWEEENFGVLVNHISPEVTSAVVNLMVDDTWQIKVRAIDEEGNWCDSDGTNSAGYAEDLSRLLTVKVDSAPPGPVSLASPYDGEYFDGRNVTINWNSAEDADLDYYEVVIGTDPNDIHGSAVFSENFTPEVTSCEVNLPGGIYYVYIAAYDKAEHYRNLKGETDIPEFDLEPAIAFDNVWPMFEIDHTPPDIMFDHISFLPLSNPHFSPNGDGVKDDTAIRFGIVDDTYYKDFPASTEVKVEILDNASSVIKSWHYPEFPPLPGWEEIFWDGTTDGGQLAADGIYTIKITATDKALNTVTDETLTVVVDTSPPEINNIANTSIFSPNGDGEFDTDTLDFELSDNLAEDLATTVDVLNSADVVIRSVEESRRLVAGSDSMSVVWDGKVGEVVPDGPYIYHIMATDNAGNASIATTNITIDTTPPTIADVSTFPKREVTFTETSGALDINFTVSELANVRLAIYDSNYSIIRDYVVSIEAEVNNTISWDGRDSFGSLVPDNTYITYAFSATDQVANSSSYSSGDIVRVETPVTGLAGNIIYSQDGEVKIIIPAGAVAEGTEFYIEEFDTVSKSYQVDDPSAGSGQGKDNITLTYKFAQVGSTEEVIFNKTPTLIMHYDESLLNFEHQSVELWRYGSGWTKLYGNTHSDTFTAYIEKTGEFALFADLTPPDPPVIAQPTSPTKEESIIIAGTAEPYSKVDLWINGLKRSPPINVGSDGTFSADILLSEGLNSIYGQATDQTGNVGSDSELISVELDTTPPTITLNSPQDIYISPNGDSIQDEATISASTDGISIIISVRDSQNNILASSSSGTLTVGGALLTSDGAYPYVVKAFDELGNEARKDGKIIVDTIPPDAYLYSDVITPIVSGKLPLSALADDVNFARYVLDYGVGVSPTSWTWLNESFINVTYQKIADADTALLEDDAYTFRLRVYDKAGNSSSSTLSKQTVNAELYGSISFPIINQVIKETIEVHGNIIGTNFGEYRVEYGVGENPTSWQIIASATTLPADPLLATWDTTSVSDGNYTLKLRVINIGGGTSDHSVPVKVDNSPPSVSISSPQLNQVLADTININGSIVDENFSYYKVEYASQANPADWHLIRDKLYTLPSPLAAWNTAAVSDGNYLIKLTAVDVVGNLSSSQVQMIVDNTYPIANISGPSSGDILGGTINIAGTASDDNLDSVLLEYQESFNPGVWHTIATLGPTNIVNDTIYDWNAGSLNGDYTVRVTATDKTGKTTSDEVFIRMDNTDPLISITLPTGESVNAGIVDFVGEISDLNLDQYTIKYGYGIEPTRWWDLILGSASETGTIYSWNTPDVKDGYYTIKIDAVDKAGNSSSREFVITVDNAPAVASIHEPTANQVIKGTVAVSGIACDADFTTYNFEKYEISVGTGLVPVQWTTIESLVIPKINETLTNWNTAPFADGTYTLKLKSQDISGVTETTRTVIVDNTNPTASITSPTQGQTVSGSIDIIGTASDTNLSEYKVYYKHTDSAIWTEIGGGTSSLVASSLANWNTIDVGDGLYSIKLRVKDKAGNEKEVTRNVTVNNVLAVVNDSASPTTISPNGDGVDDVADIAYTLSENSPVTVKIYKKPQYDTFKWEAKGFGTRYPEQQFSYTISASGTEYLPQVFDWKVNGYGVETYYTYSSKTSPTAYAYANDDKGVGESSTFYLNHDQTPGRFYFKAIADGNSGWDDARKYWVYRQNGGAWDEVYYHSTYCAGEWSYIGNASIADNGRSPESTFYLSQTKSLPFYVGTDNNCKTSEIWIYRKEGASWITFHHELNPAANKWFWKSLTGGYLYKIKLRVEPKSGTYTCGGFYVDNLTWSAGTYKLKVWLDVGMWDSCHVYMWMDYKQKNTLYSNVFDSDSGIATVYYNGNGGTIGGDNSYSVTLSPQHPGGTISGKEISYSVTNQGGRPDSWIEPTSRTGDWSGNSISGTVNAAYNYSGDVWSDVSDPVSDSCNALGGTITASNAMSNIFGAPNVYPDYREYSSFSVSDNNPNVSVWFNNSGTTSTSDPNDYLRASTSYSESWDTSKDSKIPAVNNGWIKSVEISAPFNYDESSQSFSDNYTPPSDVILSSWTVNLKNPDGGASADVVLDGTPTAGGNFNVKVADSLLVKTLQYNASTAPGSQTIEWDGKDSGGNYVADGDYIYYIYAGPNIVKKSGMIKVERSSEISSTSLSEEYISPNGDGIKDNATINYTLSENATVNIEVSDSDGIAVKSFSASGNQEANSTSWDGKNNSGTVVEDGEYTIKINASNANGASRSKELTVVVDNNSLTAGEIMAEQMVSSGKDPVYSPDKLRIAYVKEVSGDKQIFALNLSDLQTNQLTSAGNNFQPAWSPNGTKITFSSDRSGNNDIWIMDADGSDQKQISSDDASETSPAFSPDGQRVAYASNRAGELGINKWNIWIVDLDGTNPTQITADENTYKDDSPTWSPDGKKLGFASDQNSNFDIWSINLDGSSKSQMTSSSETETMPAWSPDGLKVVYTKGNDIYQRKISTGEEAKIATGENPAWSRDGTEIAYNTSDNKVYSKKVYAGALTGVITQPILDQTLTGLAEVRGTALDTNLASYKLEFSPNIMPYAWVELAGSSTPIINGILGVWNTADVADGEYILRLTVNDKAGNSLENTVVVNADNDNWKLTITNLKQLTSDEAWDIEPAWSPDSSKIAFSSSRSGNYDIWVMNADGSGLQNITNNSALDVKPVWAPDGTKIAFVSDRSGNKDIWVTNADGSGTPLQLTDLTIVDTNPTWSPDGTKIAFASDRSGNFDIWLVNSDGTGTPTKLASSEALDKEPSWSQFGIAFTSDRSGDKEIWMIEDVNNPNPFRLTYNSAEDKEPCWAPIAIPLPDASSRPLIAFTSNRNENLDIWVMDTDGIDQSKSLTDYTNVDCNPAWSPDGSKVAYASYKDSNYDIWVMSFGINATVLSVRTQQSTSLEVVAPKDGKKVETIRPTFSWYGIREHTKYRAVVSCLGETNRNLEKTITSSEAYPDRTKTGDIRPRIAYQIHEFDEGLSPGNWNWKVQALNDDNSVLAESAEESFEIEPDFTLTGVTNYPNPFNPNREKTNLRYRLGADADEVRVRIYDITGSLVIQIDNCPTDGEGSSVWDKYNKVEWDGRNGRGDKVVNGIYPFEVRARSGDKSVSARGKIAVLK